MGYFHAGHLALMQWARENADRVYVSVFVNPSQFSPAEDFGAYPRDAEHDARLAEDTGCDVLFMPEVEGMYPPGHATIVEVPDLAKHLCGMSRPNHFKGVATVVSMLLNLAHPTYAVFGKKDRQQLAIIRRMAKDMHLPTEIVGRPTIREADGLAMSSRNSYLTPGERAQAWHIQEGLRQAKSRVESGVSDPAKIKSGLKEYYRENILQGILDYVEIVDEETMQPVDGIGPGSVAAAAVRLGKARLIDNITLIQRTDR